MSGHIEVLDAQATRGLLADSALLTNLDASFPDWCFKSTEGLYTAIDIDWLLPDILADLVAIAAESPGGEILFLDTQLALEVPGRGALARSFRVPQGTNPDEVVSLVRGGDARFGLGNDTVVGRFDFLVVSPWCEIRAFLPDYAFVAFRQGVPQTVRRVFAERAWGVEELLEFMGALWWSTTMGSAPRAEGRLREAIPEALRSQVEAKYSRLIGTELIDASP